MKGEGLRYLFMANVCNVGQAFISITAEENFPSLIAKAQALACPNNPMCLQMAHRPKPTWCASAQVYCSHNFIPTDTTYRTACEVSFAIKLTCHDVSTTKVNLKNISLFSAHISYNQ